MTLMRPAAAAAGGAVPGLVPRASFDPACAIVMARLVVVVVLPSPASVSACRRWVRISSRPSV